MNYGLGYVDTPADVYTEEGFATVDGADLNGKGLLLLQHSSVDDVIGLAAYGFGKGPRVLAEAMMKYDLTPNVADMPRWNCNYRAVFEDGSELRFEHFNRELNRYFSAFRAAVAKAKENFSGYPNENLIHSTIFDNTVRGAICFVLADDACRNARRICKDVYTAYATPIGVGDGTVRPISNAEAAEFEGADVGVPLVQRWENPWMLYARPGDKDRLQGIRFAPLAVLTLTDAPLASGYARGQLMGEKEDPTAFLNTFAHSADMVNGKTLGACLLIAKKQGATGYGNVQGKYSVFLLGGDTLGVNTLGYVSISPFLALGGRQTAKEAVEYAKSLFAGGLFKAAEPLSRYEDNSRKDRRLWIVGRAFAAVTEGHELYRLHRDVLTEERLRECMVENTRGARTLMLGVPLEMTNALLEDIINFIQRRPGNGGLDLAKVFKPEKE